MGETVHGYYPSSPSTNALFRSAISSPFGAALVYVLIHHKLAGRNVGLNPRQQ